MAGCAYGKVTREKVENMDKKIDKLSDQFTSFDERTTYMFNHLSNRLPAWGTWALAVLVAIVGAMIGRMG